MVDGQIDVNVEKKKKDEKKSRPIALSNEKICRKKKGEVSSIALLFFVLASRNHDKSFGRLDVSYAVFFFFSLSLSFTSRQKNNT